jgi:hypothetical protein
MVDAFERGIAADTGIPHRLVFAVSPWIRHVA